MAQINALSIDFEEWFHPELIRKYCNLQKVNRIRESTEKLLDLLNKYNVKATFFVVGQAARQNPELIKKIYSNGHEIACHGFTHRPLHELGPEGLRNELQEFKKVITDIIGNIEIKGFRAPTFSLNHATSWAVDILKEFKFKYDSSIFPVKYSLYGVKGAPLDIYGLNSNNLTLDDTQSSLKEFPITVFEAGKIRLAISGGFYLRSIPFFLQKWVLKMINQQRPLIIYVHPWECASEIPKIRINPLSSFVTYYNIKSTLTKLEKLLHNFNFGRIDNILKV